jgi:hypothetical protein
MKHRNSILSLIATIGLTLRNGGAAHAQGHEVSQDVQLSAGYCPNHAAHVAGGGSYPGLATVDLDLEWHIPLDFQFVGHKLVLYSVVGATPVTITHGNGYSANAGFGAKYYLTDNVFIDLDGRYRYLSKIASNLGQGMNTSGTSLPVASRF